MAEQSGMTEGAGRGKLETKLRQNIPWELCFQILGLRWTKNALMMWFNKAKTRAQPKDP